MSAESLDGLEIAWPEPSLDRIKRVITRSGTRRRYVVPCYRHGDREAHCEADEEAKACILLDACAGVEFQEQALRIAFNWRGDRRQHIPDLLVATETDYELWECKRAGEAGQFRIRKRSERLREVLAPLQIGYRVVTGRNLCVGSYLANARQLRRFAKLVVPESACLEADLRVRRAGHMPLRELADAIDTDEPIWDVLALIYRGSLRTDLSVPLMPESSIYPPVSNGSKPWVWKIFDPVCTYD